METLFLCISAIKFIPPRPFIPTAPGGNLFSNFTGSSVKIQEQCECLADSFDSFVSRQKSLFVKSKENDCLVLAHSKEKVRYLGKVCD